MKKIARFLLFKTRNNLSLHLVQPLTAEEMSLFRNKPQSLPERGQYWWDEQ